MKKLFLLMGLAVSMSFAMRIGVLKGTGATCSETVSIKLDAEDHDNATKIVSGDKNPPGMAVKHNVTFTYCVVDVDKAPQATFDYAVLRLDYDCPTNGYRFARHHDTEDDDNANSYTGNIYPNVVNKNATLEYCFVPSESGSKLNYPFENKGYGVFANPTNLTNMVHSEIKIDDEDDQHKVYKGDVGGEPWYDYHNNDSWNYYALCPCMINRVHQIIHGEENTYYNTVLWTGSSSAILAKASDVNAPSVAESQISAASAAAASIKGFSRTAVNVELESAGKVEVSVVGINGAVVAKVVKENLQAGSHDIGWNLANVPNGRYIVAVKHNGKMSAKNVILK